MSREYKHCPNGHYYQGEICPYCQSQQDKPIYTITYVTVKACPNRHAYDEYKQECPVCGSKEVIKVYECRDSLYFHVDFIVPEVMVNEKSIYGVEAVRMCVSQGNTYDYAFVGQKKEAHSFEPGDDILVGTTRLKGREIMRMCDMALDNKLSILVQNVKLSNMSKYVQCSNGHYYNSEEYDNCPYGKSAFSDNYALEYGHNVFNNPTISDDGKPVFSVKVCPNGHGYDANQMACPFCGSDIVSEVIEERCSFTLAIADLSYERDGISTLCKHAEVDGDMLSGDLCMRIEYTGSFKYAYYIAHKQKGTSGGLIINPQSHIVLSGDGFSDTFTGCEFYKMCDELFEKKESINQGGQDDTLINKKVGNTCCEPELQKDILVEPKKSLDFKQCSNGHYYQGDTCPYCKPEKKVISIGSVVDNDYIVANPLVSEHHCRIEKVGDDRYRIYDLGSANGTFVNGSRVEGSCPLNPFDQVLVGNMVVPWMHHFASDHIRKDSILSGVVNEIPGSIGPVEDLPRKQTGRLVPYPDTMNPMRVEFTLYEGRNTIGRNTYCNITINDNRASWTHAVILFRAGKHSITDQHSAHGTFVNGKDINLEPFYLNEGDVITIGNTLLQFHSIPSDPNK